MRSSAKLLGELGHLMLGHDIDGRGDVIAFEREADELAVEAMRGNEDLLAMGASSYFVNASMSLFMRHVGGAVDAIGEGIGALERGDFDPNAERERKRRMDLAMYRIVGCDVTHGTMVSRIASMLDVAIGRGDSRVADWKGLREDAGGLIVANEEVCKTPPSTSSE